MKINKSANKVQIKTYEGGKAAKINALEELRRSTMSCLLWENEFYEDGESIATRITKLIDKCVKQGLTNEVINVMLDAKAAKLRHCPLWMIVGIFKAGAKVDKETIAKILTRPDDMGELIALYMQDGKKPLPNAMKKGIAIAFAKFDEYQLAKYNRQAVYKLVDIANLCHPKVTEAIDKLVKGTLETPKTWEVLLSAAGSDKKKKKDAWLNMLESKKLPSMAFLKNVRGILECGINKSDVTKYLKDIKPGMLLPIDFIRAGQNCPEIENEIEVKMFETFAGKDKILGKTALLVDVSGSMNTERLKYALALAMIGREKYDDVSIYSFSNIIERIPNRRGFALGDAIYKSQIHLGTEMWKSIREVSSKDKFDRIIVITDEQTCDSYSSDIKLGDTQMYIINVASYDKGVGYWHNITHINGFSDKVFDAIDGFENLSKNEK